MLTPPTESRLAEALGIEGSRLLALVLQAAFEADTGVWLVGGGARDVAAGSPLHDLDLAFAGPIDAFLDSVEAAVGVPVERNARFGTARFQAHPWQVDLAHLRTESYREPGALPDVALLPPDAPIEADLARRDFTVNAIALRLTGVGSERGDLHDPYGGLDDLKHHRLRVLHDRSFIDDPTRIWRGARTAAIQNLTVEDGTLALIDAGLPGLATISGNRIWTELDLAADRRRTRRTMQLLDAWGALAAVHPAWTLTEAAHEALARRGPLPGARLLALTTGHLPATDRRAIADRLAVSRDVRDTVEGAAMLLARAGALRAALGLQLEDDAIPVGLLREVEHVSDEALVAALWLDEQDQYPFQRALSRWRRAQPPLEAEALLALGVPRGPELGRELAWLREQAYLGTLTTADAATEAVRARLQHGDPED